MSVEILCVVVPLEHVCPDNDRYGPRGHSGIGTTKRWRASLAAIGTYALAQCRERGHREPWDGLVTMHGRVAYPVDRTHWADLGAFRKAIEDGLQKIVYVNDRQIVRARWEIIGVAARPFVNVLVQRYPYHDPRTVQVEADALEHPAGAV